MLRHIVKNHGNEQDEVELSRRSFFGRLAVGAALSMGIPGIAHAVKSTAVKADKNHRLAKSAKGAVRLPKHSAIQTNKEIRQTDKSARHAGAGSYKSAAVERGHLHTASADYRAQHNTRVRDVYTGKKYAGHTTSSYTNRNYHEGRSHSVIQPVQREPIVASVQEPLFLADHG
ncbi:MAG: YcbK family protein, partial [Methylomonas sp.]